MTPEQELDLQLAEPPHGSVVKIRVAYPDSPRTYTYSAVNINGQWYVTGWSEPDAPTWVQLLSWFKAKNADLLSFDLATGWEPLL